MYELHEELSNTFAITILPDALNGQIMLQYAETWASNEVYLWTIDQTTGVQTKLLSNLVGSSPFPQTYAMLGTDQQIHYVTKAIGPDETEAGLVALVVTDGSIGGTKEIRTFDPDIEGDIMGIVALADDKVLIFQMRVVNDPTVDLEVNVTDSLRNSDFSNLDAPPTTVMDVWVTDGTAEGTVLAMSLLEDSMVMKAHAISKNRIVLLVTKMTDQQLISTYDLWVTNGTPEGTSLVYTSPLSLENNDTPVWQFLASQTFVTAWNQDRLYFTGYDVAHGIEPWVMHFEPDPNDASAIMDEKEVSSSTKLPVLVGTSFLVAATIALV